MLAPPARGRIRASHTARKLQAAATWGFGTPRQRTA
jgi:hypothetical protein